MTPPDRISELRRQRQLMAEHLAWLDREIADAAPTGDDKPASPVVVQGSAAQLAQAGDAEAILEQYRDESASTPMEARAGCLRLAIGGTIIAMAVLFFIYWFSYRKPSDAEPPHPMHPVGCAPANGPIHRHDLGVSPV